MHERRFELGLLLARFGTVGAAATLFYAVLVAIFGFTIGIAPLYAHGLAYLFAIPLSYIGQRKWAFRHKGSKRASFFRFLVAALSAFIISTALVMLILAAGYPAILGTLCTMVVVPSVSFVVMRFWVFKEPQDNEESTAHAG